MAPRQSKTTGVLEQFSSVYPSQAGPLSILLAAADPNRPEAAALLAAMAEATIAGQESRLAREQAMLAEVESGTPTSIAVDQGRWDRHSPESVDIARRHYFAIQQATRKADQAERLVGLAASKLADQPDVLASLAGQINELGQIVVAAQAEITTAQVAVERLVDAAQTGSLARERLRTTRTNRFAHRPDQDIQSKARALGGGTDQQQQDHEQEASA